MVEERKIWAVKDGYLVHRDGNIYKLNWKRTGTMRRIKQSKNEKGYLFFNCNGKYMKSHRFVAECFIPNPDNLPEINHKDENKQNNCVDNLEWCDRKYNVNYGTAKQRWSEKNKGKKRSEETRKKISEAMIKHYANEENRKKLSEAKKKALEKSKTC